MGCFPLVSLSWSPEGGQEAASKKEKKHGYRTESLREMGTGLHCTNFGFGAAWGDTAHTNVATKSKRTLKAIGGAAKGSNNLCNSLTIKALAQEAEVEETKPSSTRRGLDTVRSRKQLHLPWRFFPIIGLRTRLGRGSALPPPLLNGDHWMVMLSGACRGNKSNRAPSSVSCKQGPSQVMERSRVSALPRAEPWNPPFW